MLNHRVGRKTQLAGDSQPFGLGFDAALKSDAVIGAKRFHAIQLFEKIEMPHGAAQLAIRGAVQADLRLPGDNGFDRRILHGSQIGGRNFSAFTAGARLFQ